MLDNLYKNNAIKNNRLPSCLYTIASNDDNQANDQKK